MPHIPVVIIVLHQAWSKRWRYVFLLAVKRRIANNMWYYSKRNLYRWSCMWYNHCSWKRYFYRKIYLWLMKSHINYVNLDEISKVLNVHALEIKMPLQLQKWLSNSELTGKFTQSPIFNRDKAKEMLQRYWYVMFPKQKWIKISYTIFN